MEVSKMPHVSVTVHYKNNQSTMVQTEIRRNPQETTEIKTTTDTRITAKITQEKRRIENRIKELNNEHNRLDRQQSSLITSDVDGINVVV